MRFPFAVSAKIAGHIGKHKLAHEIAMVLRSNHCHV
jgi:hypothetical protein